MSFVLVSTTGVKLMKIAKAKRQECLKYFEKGYGYKKTSALTGLNLYTVRDYLRRYKAGDISWAERNDEPAELTSLFD